VGRGTKSSFIKRGGKERQTFIKGKINKTTGGGGKEERCFGIKEGDARRGERVLGKKKRKGGKRE